MPAFTKRNKQTKNKFEWRWFSAECGEVNWLIFSWNCNLEWQKHSRWFHQNTFNKRQLIGAVSCWRRQNHQLTVRTHTLKILLLLPSSGWNLLTPALPSLHNRKWHHCWVRSYCTWQRTRAFKHKEQDVSPPLCVTDVNPCQEARKKITYW